MDTLTNTPPPISSGTMNSDKLSGQLIIKAQLGDDIRKMMIHNEDLTLNELVLMMERIFAGKISNSDEITIKYLDDDGDKITLLNDSDLTVALHFHKLLRLFVFINGNEQTNTNSIDKLTKEENLVDAKTYRNELQQIRNSVQTILDRLQLSTNEVPAPVPPPTTTTTTTAPTSTIVSSTTREFDPYKNLQQQQQRSATPPTNFNRQVNNEQQQTAPTIDTQNVETTNTNQMPPSTFSQTQMPTPHFMPTNFPNDQQTKQNIFGPPPTTFPNMPSSQYLPPTTISNNNTQPIVNPTSTLPPSTINQPSGFIGQQTSTPPQQGGFYGQQQALFHQRPPLGNFNANNAFVPPQTAPSPSNSSPATMNSSFIQQPPPPSNSSPATINPSFIQPPPPMASQQPYGAYPQQNSYYNPVQQYPNTS